MKASKQRKPSASAEKGIVGAPLMPNASIGVKYAEEVQALIKRMALEAQAELKAMFTAPGYALDEPSYRNIREGSPAARARIIINKLLKKYQPLFDDVAESATARMIRRTIKHVDVTASMSLKEMSEAFVLKDFWSPRLQEIVAASTNEAAQLIKTLPQTFLAKVQGETMRSIVSGRGLADLTPFLEKAYQGAKFKARVVALDQTRKAYSALSSQRMQDAGVKEFQWRHSGGGHEPRKQHQAWSGKTFRYDDPPVDDKFGPVLPGAAISCRCYARPVLSFGDDE
jgi:SPP1 gp7 family putative phage head morphogenesis protein